MPENVDPAEIEQFSKLAAQWWDTQGPFKPLHDINPLRLSFIEAHCDLKELTIIDVGCGGGLLSEAMAKAHAQVTGIDLATANIEVAKLHLHTSKLQIDYQVISVEDLATQRPGSADVVTCMEMLEHVPDPTSVVQSCAQLLKPGGHAFFSTLNRNLKSFLMAIVGAEHVLKLIPKGTHHYEKFTQPAELNQWCRHANLTPQHTSGLHYHPLKKTYSLAPNTDVNYLLHCVKT